MFANLTVRTRLALLLAVNLMLFLAAGYAWYAITRLNGHISTPSREHRQVEPQPGAQGQSTSRCRCRSGRTSSSAATSQATSA